MTVPFRTVETDWRVDVPPFLRTRFRRRADAACRRLNRTRLVPSYRWEVVREGGRYVVVAMQNVARPSYEEALAAARRLEREFAATIPATARAAASTTDLGRALAESGLRLEYETTLLALDAVCGKIEARCVCKLPRDHDGPHVCVCGGSWEWVAPARAGDDGFRMVVAPPGPDRAKWTT